jgi:dihydrofolate reductase
MRVSLVAAIAANRVIGNGGKLPWLMPDDLSRFRRLTFGHPVVMGRKTWESIGKPLEGRRNIVLSRDAGFRASGCRVAHSLEEAIESALPSSELFVIGGASLYALFLPLADLLYITHIDADFPGDTLFPPVRWEEWRVLGETPAPNVPAGSPPHRFVDYARRTP